jgi:S-adenosylmethionine hydrolase
MGIKTLYQITNQDLFGWPITELFASQILGKVGALIASDYHPEDVGPAVDDPKTFDVQEATILNDKLIGAVVFIDHFGNCLTNISRETSNRFGLSSGDVVQITTLDDKIAARFGNTYANVPQGEAIIFVNRLDVIELAINIGNFSKTYNLKTGTKIKIEIKK